MRAGLIILSLLSSSIAVSARKKTTASTADYDPSWQTTFEVTEPLTNVTWDVGRSWAGNLPVQRGGANNSLFFWGFENTNGSMTSTTSDEPWGIWLNGGPGASSMIGLLFEHGPIHVNPDYSVTQNEYSWTQLADYFYIDNPVGVGFSTVESESSYAGDEDQIASDFVGFLENLVKVFPGLATRPLHLQGESYAGMYIPYIAKALYAMSSPPVKLAQIAIGDGTVGSGQVYNLVPLTTVIETYPQLINYDQSVLAYFQEQEHLCGYDLNLTYPQTGGSLPSLGYTAGANPITVGYVTPESSSSQENLRSSKLLFRLGQSARWLFRSWARLEKELARRHALYLREEEKEVAANRAHARDMGLVSREKRGSQWKRDLSGRANGTLDPWYGCDMFDELLDYALNFTQPWADVQNFDVYDIPDALNPEVNMDGSVFLNDPQVKTAIHAPSWVTWQETVLYNFSGPGGADPSSEPMVFLNELAVNATKANTSIVLFYGNDDMLIPHTGGEVVIQNTTFGGIQGFTVKPGTPWYDDAGEFAGIVHQERGWKYALVKGAGHMVGYYNPSSAYVLARDFFFGSNTTGLVTTTTTSGGNTFVVGGESATLTANALPGASGVVYLGDGATQSTYYFPEPTVAAWKK